MRNVNDQIYFLLYLASNHTVQVNSNHIFKYLKKITKSFQYLKFQYQNLSFTTFSVCYFLRTRIFSYSYCYQIQVNIDVILYLIYIPYSTFISYTNKFLSAIFSSIQDYILHLTELF